MGAKLSIENDVSDICLIEVWTPGQGFLVRKESVKPGKTLTFSLWKAPYDVRFRRHGDIKTEGVYLPSGITTLHLSAIYEPSKNTQPITRSDGGEGYRLEYNKDATAGEFLTESEMRIFLTESEMRIYLEAGGKVDDRLHKMIELQRRNPTLSSSE